MRQTTNTTFDHVCPLTLSTLTVCKPTFLQMQTRRMRSFFYYLGFRVYSPFYVASPIFASLVVSGWHLDFFCTVFPTSWPRLPWLLSHATFLTVLHQHDKDKGGTVSVFAHFPLGCYARESTYMMQVAQKKIPTPPNPKEKETRRKKENKGTPVVMLVSWFYITFISLLHGRKSKSEKEKKHNVSLQETHLFGRPV